MLSPTNAVKTASIITRGFVSATKSEALQRSIIGSADSDDNAKRARVSPSWPATDLTFISLLRVHSNESVVLQRCPFTMDPPPRPRLNAAAPLGGQTCSKLPTDEFKLAARFETARFGMIRACFNNRASPGFVRLF